MGAAEMQDKVEGLRRELKKYWWRQMVRVRGFMVQSSASSAEKVGSVGYLVNECGWKVRRLVEKADEMRMVAQVQAEAFHVPVALFNDFFFDFFQVEVLSGLAYKLRSSPPNRYACLVAEAMANVSDSQKQLVGVVDVTVLRDQTVLDHLPPEAEEYLYVSGIAVLKAFRLYISILLSLPFLLLHLSSHFPHC